MLIVWQSGVFSVFAATLPVTQNYIYIQSSPITNDAWIGTRISSLGTAPAIQPISSPTRVLTQTIDSSWLGNFVRKIPTQVSPPVVTQSAPYPMMPIVYTTPNGTLLNNIYAPSTTSSYIAPVYIASVNSVFGRSGSIMGQLGDYTTSLITEGTNFYFTDIRAQNALSGVVNTLSNNIASTNASL